MDDVAEILGYEPSEAVRKKLARRIRKAEKKNNCKILIGERPLTTTVPLLRRHIPEWFDQRDRHAEEILSHFKSISKRIQALERGQLALGSKVRSIGIRLTVVEQSSTTGQSTI